MNARPKGTCRIWVVFSFNFFGSIWSLVWPNRLFLGTTSTLCGLFSRTLERNKIYWEFHNQQIMGETWNVMRVFYQLSWFTFCKLKVINEVMQEQDSTAANRLYHAHESKHKFYPIVCYLFYFLHSPFQRGLRVWNCLILT